MFSFPAADHAVRRNYAIIGGLIMFGKLMNNFYYGKSGKGDFNKEDLPSNRFQLFFEMLRIRLSALCRLNLMTVIVFAPLIFVLTSTISTYLNGVTLQYNMVEAVSGAGIVQPVPFTADQAEDYLARCAPVLAAAEFTEDPIAFWNRFCGPDGMMEFTQQLLYNLMLLLIPCLLITGPVEAGIAYVTRNWARDEHAFLWQDFKDALKANWKQALGVSAITSVFPVIVYVAWNFYSAYTEKSMFFIVPQMLVAMLGIVWMLGLLYMYPMMISYKVSFKDLLKNSLLLGIARLPQNVGIWLLHLLPLIIFAVLLFFTTVGYYALMAVVIYYIVLGIALARFVNASLSNAVFDRFINSHMEGVEINRGLRSEEDDDEADSEDEAQAGENAASGSAPSAGEQK